MFVFAFFLQSHVTLANETKQEMDTDLAWNSRRSCDEPKPCLLHVHVNMDQVCTRDAKRLPNYSINQSTVADARNWRHIHGNHHNPLVSNMNLVKL